MAKVSEKKIDEYPDILEPQHIREIMGIGEKQTYELLNQSPPPFHYIRIGKRIKISKAAFIKWIDGTIDTNFDTNVPKVTGKLKSVKGL